MGEEKLAEAHDLGPDLRVHQPDSLYDRRTLLFEVDEEIAKRNLDWSDPVRFKFVINPTLRIVEMWLQTVDRSVSDAVWQRYGWKPREYQSKDFVTVPKAMLEEARDSLSGGDAKGVLEMLVGKR